MVRLLSSLASLAVTASSAVAASVFSTTCNGKPYTYDELAGYGFVPSNARDKFGDSISLGSAISISSWAKKGSKYEGKLWALPDRGWNTQGTVNYQPRVHQFTVTLTLAPGATAASPAKPNVAFVYKDTILLTGPDGKAITALDADQTGGLQFPGFPLLPAATFTGDGFGGVGRGGKAITIDAEALVLSEDGGFWISDEYGPYIYKFDRNGKLTSAIAPPDALLPLRNGSVSFPSNNAPRYDPTKVPIPANPTQGRQNNQGFEGMTISPNGKYLWVLLQSAARQEGGSSPATRIHARLLKYTIKNAWGWAQKPVYTAEYVVPLPTFTDAAGKTLIAAQSELHFISDTQFFFLPRDSAAGHGMVSSTSLYRHVDIFDISAATNVKSAANDAFNGTIASAAGVLNPGIVPATVCPFIDFNINAQLNRFGLHNGGAQDQGLLNEKWEGLALVPVDAADCDDDDEYFLFASADNDFVSQNGFMKFGQIPFADISGFDLDNQMLVFKITIPKGSNPLIA